MFKKVMILLTVSTIFLWCSENSTNPKGDLSEVGEVVNQETIEDTTATEVAPDLINDEKGAKDDFNSEIEPPTDIKMPDTKIDDVKPTVLKASPEQGKENVDIPFKVKITFSEPMLVSHINKDSFKVFNYKNKPLNGTIKVDTNDTVFTFIPSDPALIASPYRVELNGSLIMDKAKNKMDDWFEYTFFTRPPKNMEKYVAIAQKYAPLINQETDPTAPQYDYLTAIDFDKNWDGTDNKKHIATSIDKVPSHIYYSVVETYSHYFITYMFFHPFRNVTESDKQFSNDTSGAMVVVKKYPEEEPIAVETYFKKEDAEQSYAFVTTESGIVPDGSDPYNSAFVNAVYSKDELFPNNRFIAYLVASKHESCLWNWEGEKANIGVVTWFCKLSVNQKDSMKKIQYIYKGGQVDELTKVSNAFPSDKQDVGYGLDSMIVKLWPRRFEENLFQKNYKTYTPVDGRPGTGVKISTSFVSSNDEIFGKAPWAWQWKPGTLKPYQELPMGMWFLDPAWYFSTRHKIQPEFNNDSHVGFSVDYCLNPYFNIDQRTTNPLCMDQN